MSRIAKKPIALPKGVELKTQDGTIAAKGPKGSLSMAMPSGVELAMEDGQAVLSPVTPDDMAITGTMRSIIANMVQGVFQGFERKLELVGVGYRAAMKGRNLSLQLGFSHDVDIPPPEGVTFAVGKPTEIKITGTDKQMVGEMAARIRKIRPPEPYKGKGVRYAGEKVRRKEGKKK